jgi:hypothetical protein
VPRMSYLSGQAIQSYVPPFMPSSQGIMPALSWSNYMVSYKPLNFLYTMLTVIF